MAKITTLPSWAQSMKDIFKTGTVNQFILSGNIHDYIPCKQNEKIKFSPLKEFLAETMFAPMEVVIYYNRGQGIRLIKGADSFFQYLQIFDKFNRTRFAADSGATDSGQSSLDLPGLLPRDPARALELIDRFIHFTALNTLEKKNNFSRSAAVILDYANYLLPRGESLYMSGELGASVIKIMEWAQEPAILGANILSVLISENLADLNALVVESPFTQKIIIPLPGKEEIEEYVNDLVREDKNFPRLCQVTMTDLAGRLVGLSRINIRNVILQAIGNDQPVTIKFLSQIKKKIIEKEASDRLDFLETTRTLDDVAGHQEAKQWLREDAKLFKKGAWRALPMGYLINGRIGTGKTYLIECYAGECGIPFVALKNFREKWVGATEGNMEKIFTILHALGQVVVFVDEADQVTGRRDSGEGDSGLSGRVYAMMAREMANTENRGKILWIFATSRPDLLEVDLKRQGRLDVHIPLFPPQDEAGTRDLFVAMARKLKVDLKPEDIPAISRKEPIGGNEIEGMIVRSLRQFELQDDSPQKKTLGEILQSVIKEFRPSIHSERLEFMDLLAVKECTDERFLPERYKKLSKEEIEKRLKQLSW